MIKSKYINLLFFIIVFLLTRILFLDSDLPAWNISQYQAMDEFYYSIGGFNLFREGTFAFSYFDFITEPQFITNYFTEFITYISLSCFGNNYYGLRLSSVFSGLMIIYIFYSLLSSYQKEKQISTNITRYILLYMLIDFSFIMSNRVLEPTIFRMLIMLVILWITCKLTETKITFYRTFFLGFLAFASFIYVYTTNLFIIPAIGLSILIFSYLENPKKSFKIILVYILAILLSLTFFLIFYHMVFDRNYLSDFIEMIHIRESLISHYLMNIPKFFNTNIFKYNQLLLFFTLLAIPSYIYIVFKKQNRQNIIIFSFFILFIAQNIFINDYYERKLIILFPFVLYMIGITFMEKAFIFSQIDNFKKKWGVYLYLSITFLITVVFNTLERSHSVIQILNYMMSFYGLIYMFLYINKIRNKYLNILLLIAIFSSNIIMDIKYIFLNPTYHYKSTMIALSKDINNSYTIGFSHGFRLYNTSKPLMSTYVYKYYTPKDKYSKDKDRLIRKNNKIFELNLVDINISDKHNTYDFNPTEDRVLEVIKYEKKKTL